nr:hypothetical protein [Paenibacillus barengoltzii]
MLNDTHWNSMGAFVAYREVAKSLEQDSVVSKPLHLENYEVLNVMDGGDLANMLSMNDILIDDIITLKPKYETAVKSAEVDATLFPNPNLLVVKENTSFSGARKLLM